MPATVTPLVYALPVQLLSCHSDQLIKHLANPEKYAPKKLPKKTGS
jgi:hypothetical protein